MLVQRLTLEFGCVWADIVITDDSRFLPGFSFCQPAGQVGTVTTFRMADKHLYLAQAPGHTTTLVISVEAPAYQILLRVARSGDGPLTIIPVGEMPTRVSACAEGVVVSLTSPQR